MKRFSLILATLLLLPLSGFAAEDTSGSMDVLPEAPANLRQAIEVDATYILLGDLFSGVVKFAEKPVAYAPQPGKTSVFDARWLGSLARSYGVKWRPVSQYEKVTVTRSSKVINREMIAEEIRAALADYDVGQDDEITMSNRNIRFFVPASSDASVAVRNLSFDDRSQRFIADVEAPAGAPDAQRMRISGRVFTTTDVPMLTRNIGKDDVIKEADIQWVTVRAREVRQDTATNVDEIIGKAPKRFIRAGSMIRSAELIRPQMVGKGSIVTMVLQTSALTLTTQGRALEAGSDGDTIRVQNVRSKTTILATVSEHNMVTVDLTSQALTN